MTCLVLILLTMMMVMKLRKRKRLAKKVLPSTLYSLDKDRVKIMEPGLETISARHLDRDNQGFVRKSQYFAKDFGFGIWDLDLGLDLGLTINVCYSRYCNYFYQIFLLKECSGKY